MASFKDLRPIEIRERYYEPYHKNEDGSIKPGEWKEHPPVKAFFHIFFQYTEPSYQDMAGASDAMAVVEFEDGIVKEVPTQWVRFIDRKEEIK